ncbi:hypothetical protein FXV83_16535 [Bradyrhizobium hipponense]|uniref:Uncharacterized protein n=1 Tax=Bradyrhizobium hipponense TaxID=2605638 RepID=A0A5S4YN28_9BRAD|nr:aspartyl/asparaginyl beta-hydroxylase domain-containing protein [Bradyrhizobium hipponense]TYO65538.1 hypothetical protein FXV83_16535 [Bradyrhizobium hipponense]
MSKFVELARKLDSIPHLDLGRSFEVERLQAELDSIDSALFVPYRTVSRYKQLIANNWQGLSMVAPHGSIHDDLTEEFNGPPLDATWTSVAEQCPYMKQVITELGGEGQRVRLMRVMPEGRLTWHRHGNETSVENGKILGGLRPNWHELIVHVPVRTNPEFSYEVIEVPSYQLIDFMTEPLAIHRKNYPAGEAWGFNSVHVHNVFNRSKTEPRYALMLSLDIRMKKTFDIVSKAVERYIANGEGPLMPGL